MEVSILTYPLSLSNFSIIGLITLKLSILWISVHVPLNFLVINPISISI